jgi:HD-like signal output (HDOD) protein
MAEVRSADRLAEPKRLETMMRAIEELPSIPETLIKILKVMDDPHSSARDLAEVVRLDAPLTAKILRLANSPYYGTSGRLADMRSCLAVLGYKTIRQVAICVSVATSLLSECNRRRARLDYRELWRHAVVTAAVARQLAVEAGDADPEEVFTAGLIHDLGKFVILLHAPTQYDEVVARRHCERRPLVDVELEVFGFDHAQAGEAFGRRWRFPEVLTLGARRHHERPTVVATAGRAERAAAVVTLANQLAHELVEPGSDLGHDGTPIVMPLLYEAARLSEERVEAARPAILEAISCVGDFLELA